MKFSIILIGSFVFFQFISSQSIFSQTIDRVVIGSAGNFSENSNFLMAWTIGELSIETLQEGDYSFTQGFHQPDVKSIELAGDFSIPEGFSPNEDGINDVFFIRGLVKYPNNSLTVFNRWGNKVFEATPYKNDWNGKNNFGISVGNNVLPVGTYFYLFDFGNGTQKIKGTIYLSI